MSDDEDAPIGKLIQIKKEKETDQKIPKQPKPASLPVKVEEEEDDDDLPISALIKKRALETESKEPAAKKTKASEQKKLPSSTPSKATGKPSSSSSSSKKGASSSDNSRKAKIASSSRSPSKSSAKKSSKPEKRTTSGSSSGKRIKSNDFYDTTDKGFLVQKLLVRWWYAIQWPKPGDYGSPPPGYESLDGFPGVFASTRSDSLGKIIDLRNKKTCPSLRNLSKKSSAELKELCIKACEEQIRQLIAAEGPETKLESKIRSEIVQIKKIDPEKSDRKAKAFDDIF